MIQRIFALLCISALGSASAQQDPALPPAVTMLVPGFLVRELPVRLTNINNVRYGPDGRLYCCGYDGRVHILVDTDGDGLEDKVLPFWDKKGELLTPIGMEVTRDGVYVASRGKVSLLKDTDGDGSADVRETVADGWVQERHNGNSRNDASGIALDAQGNLYFCLGCSDYTNPFLVDKEGKAHYDLKSERGTILRVSPDRKKREIVCTGIRFAVGLAFNKHGDLFATDQEGDTWFPGGNTLDELLHIEQGRHYGFPFRHPKHLPAVFDEPAVAEFGPQHQSSCGLVFNEARPGRARFGPPEWEGDAIVPGFSRGKLWRVALVKTRAGYVGRPLLIASFNSLALDAAISPNGDLVVSCHGGKPDWGSGPNGDGKLYKISWKGQETPRPVLAWPSGPLEVKVAFDRPVSAAAGASSLEAGDYVRAGDRFEKIRPGYKVVAEQQATPRHAMRIQGVTPSASRRETTLLTPAHPWRTSYALSIPDLGVEVDYTLSGLDAEWSAEGDSRTRWKGWIPHATSAVTRAWTRGSAEHEQLVESWGNSGTLTMHGQVFPPAADTALLLEAAVPFQASAGGIERKSEKAADGRHRAELRLPPGPGPFPFRATLQTGGGEPDVEIAYRAADDPHVRPLKADALAPDWAPAAKPPRVSPSKKPSGLALGDPVKGRAVFFGTEARCSVCHSIRGEGGKVAPDLTPSAQRDPDAVLQDILEPNAAINPEFVSYLVELTSGDTLNGVVLTQDAEKIVLVDAEGKERPLARAKIKQFRSSALSLMPEGFKKLGDEKLRDLVAFLCLGGDKPKNDPK
ncbi:MAG TPA: heme-binding protein [Planctomycetota bacterium]|nr:heme-binding protein [Planctomycetota bacterium]